MKTIEEFVDEYFGQYKTSKKSFKQLAAEAGIAYSNQQIELAVDKALDITSEKAVQLKENAYSLSSNGLRKEILSLRTQILNEIKDR